MRRFRSNFGFTLVELMTCVLIIGILAIIALPNFFGAQDKAKVAAVKDNMHTVQVAVEAYRTDAGKYAPDPTAIEPYFPGGSFSVGGRPGTRPENPFSHQANAPIYTESFSQTSQVVTARTNPPGAGPGSPGQVGYCQLNDGESYAVCGLDNVGKRVINTTGGALVMSNQ